MNGQHLPSRLASSKAVVFSNSNTPPTEIIEITPETPTQAFAV